MLEGGPLRLKPVPPNRGNRRLDISSISGLSKGLSGADPPTVLPVFQNAM
jgi:hypothetical protein